MRGCRLLNFNCFRGFEKIKWLFFYLFNYLFILFIYLFFFFGGGGVGGGGGGGGYWPFTGIFWGSLSKLTIFLRSNKILGMSLGIVRIGVRIFC